MSLRAPKTRQDHPIFVSLESSIDQPSATANITMCRVFPAHRCIQLFGIALTQAIASPEFEAASKWTAAGTEQQFKFGEITGVCGSIAVEGVLPKAAHSSKALFKPQYSKCTMEAAGVKFTAIVNTHECEYEVHSLKGKTTFTAESNLVNCSQGIIATVPALACELKIPEQENLKAGSGKNLKTVKGSFESEATANLEGFKYSSTKCPGLSSGSNGTYAGTAIAKGIIVIGPE